VDGAPVPTNVRVDSVWVDLDELAWQVQPVEEQARTPGASGFDATARGGPKLGPDVTVGVTVQLRDDQGRRVLLQGRPQVIQRTS
jgi:hypothetical protein